MDSEVAHNRAAGYEFSFQVRFSDIDGEGNMSLDALINAFQDCSTFHAEALGAGVDTLHRYHRAWVIAHWYVVVDRYPHLFDHLTIGTFPTRIRGPIADRSFYAINEAGEVLARGSSSWIYVDMQTGKPVRPSAEHIALYTLGTPLTMPPEKRKVAVPDALVAVEPCAVLRHHLDSNNHVNNGKYIEIALDILPFDLTPRQVRVDFRQAAHLGDAIYPSYRQQEHTTTVLLADAAQNAYAVVEFAD